MASPSERLFFGMIHLSLINPETLEHKMSLAINPNNVAGWEIEKHKGVYARLLVAGENITVLWTRWDPGAIAPEHTHPNEQVAVCLEGEIIFTVNGEEALLHAGEFIHIPSNAPHAERNAGTQPAVLTDIFSPIRADLHQGHFLAQVLDDSDQG
jgi:quercetin dioxygenase-like cupin family protein